MDNSTHPITVADIEDQAKKTRARQYSAKYRAKQKNKKDTAQPLKSELTNVELAAEFKAQRAKNAEYQRNRRANMSPEQREKENQALREYAKKRYAKMKAAYLLAVSRGEIEP